MRNRFEIIDSHCHIYPDKIAGRASQSISDFYHASTRYDGSLGRLIALGDAAGVDRFIVQSVAATPSRVESINRYIAQTAAESGGRLIGLGALHPDGADIEGDIRLIRELGLKGVKLHADIQQIAIDDPRCFKIYEILQAERLPVLLHAGDKRYNFSNPQNLAPVLKTFKNLTVVAAHFGGWSVWDDAVRLLSGFENLYVDTSSTLGFTDISYFASLISKYDTERILFGADYPMWNPADELDALFSLNLSQSTLRKILSGNCARLYG